MKKVFLAAASLFFIMVANAQLPQKPANVNITNAVNQFRKPNGTALLRKDGAIKLYATFKGSKVSEYYAIDGNGKRINATYSSSKEAANKCQVCIFFGNDLPHCYEVDCKDIPEPKKALQ